MFLEASRDYCKFQKITAMVQSLCLTPSPSPISPVSPPPSSVSPNPNPNPDPITALFISVHEHSFREKNSDTLMRKLPQNTSF